MDLKHALKQKTNCPFMWKEFNTTYLALSLCELNSPLNIWKMFYGSFKSNSFISLNDFTQISTGLSDQHKEIDISIYKNENNKLIVTFLAGNEDLDIDFIPYQIEASNFAALSGSQANPIELIEDLTHYTSVFDSKIYKGGTGHTNNKSNTCILINKKENIKYELSTTLDGWNIEKISQFNKNDNKFICRLASNTHFITLVYDLITNKTHSFSIFGKEVREASVANNICAFIPNPKKIYTDYGVCICDSYTSSELSESIIEKKVII